MEIRGLGQQQPNARLATAALTDLVPENPTDAYVKAVRDVYLYPKSSAQTAAPLTELRQQLPPADWKTLQEIPYQTADGLTRTSNFYLAPKTLDLMAADRGWEIAPDGHAVAEVVVIGAGPGGLATAYHLAEKGVKVLTLEGGFAGQAFSDAGAQAVHCIRTDRQQSSVIRTGNSQEDLAVSLGLPASLAHIAPHARQAREAYTRRTGHDISAGVVAGADDDTSVPTPRGELFEHFVEVAQHLACDSDNSMLIEKAPVKTLTRQNDGRFFLETGNGHKVYARKVVMATGLVTQGGANSKMMPVLQRLFEENRENYVMLREDADRVTRNDQLNEVLQGRSQRSLILSDRLLGTPEVQLALRQLPAGSHVAMVGSGESAAKGVLEVLYQNPDLKIDFYTKAPLEAAQIQVPSENVHPVVLEKAIDDRNFGRQTLERFQKFGTPITPRTMVQLLDLQKAGTVQIYELGKYFDEKSVCLTPNGDGTTVISIADPEVSQNLRDRRAEWAAQGLHTTPANEKTHVSMIISATGYDRGELRNTPLVEQMLAQNLMEICTDPQEGLVGQPLTSGLVSSNCADIACNTSAALTNAADSTIPGMAVRGRRLAEFLAEELHPGSGAPQPSRGGVDYVNDFDDTDFRAIARHRGLSPEMLASGDENLRTFPSPDGYLRGLAGQQQLTVAEQITLASARNLVSRMGDADFA